METTSPCLRDNRRLSPSYLRLQQCWLGSFIPSIESVYVHKDELICRPPVTPNSLGIYWFDS
ncbi:hypothetical protein F0315_02145 [Vibrio cholerae]|nr:hypothetical protein F0315_02145 [Vibrio cholerae]